MLVMVIYLPARLGTHVCTVRMCLMYIYTWACSWEIDSSHFLGGGGRGVLLGII